MNIIIVKEMMNEWVSYILDCWVEDGWREAGVGVGVDADSATSAVAGRNSGYLVN